MKIIYGVDVNMPNQKTLSSILKDYYRQINGLNKSANVESDDIKTYRRYIENIFEYLEIDTDSLKKGRNYILNDSETEIKSMLECYDDKLLESLRRNEKVGLMEIMTTPELLDNIDKKLDFVKAVYSFTEKNDLAVDYNDCETKEDFEAKLDESIDKDIRYHKTLSKAHEMGFEEKGEIYSLLNDIGEYVDNMPVDVSKDILDINVIKEKLGVFKQDIELSFAKFKKFCNAYYCAGDYYEYIPFDIEV